MLNDFYNINMIQEVNYLVEEMDKKNATRKNLYSEYQITKDNLRKLYKETDKHLENEAYKLLNSARAKGRVIAEHSKFNVKDLGEAIAKYLTNIDSENRTFYYKQMKVNYNPEAEDLRLYNVIAYADIDENIMYSFKDLKELTCFEYRPYLWDRDTDNTRIYDGVEESIQCRMLRMRELEK